MTLSDEVCSQARALVASRLGLDFPERRLPDLERGLRQAVGSTDSHALEAYLGHIADLPESSPQLMHLAQCLTIGETYFFRDPSCFGALEQSVLPALIAARRQERALRLRIWSAGCATGEEPYSIAMLLDRLLPDRNNWMLTILATDVNPEALEIAQRARYREWSFRETPRWALDRYFRRDAGGAFDLAADIRSMVTFAPLNLAASGYPNPQTNIAAMDLILCRNVLMYFTDEARRAAAARLQRALVPNGWLAVSPVEATPEVFNLLAPVAREGAGFFQRSEGLLSLDLSPTGALVGQLVRAWPLGRGDPPEADVARGSGMPDPYGGEMALFVTAEATVGGQPSSPLPLGEAGQEPALSLSKGRGRAGTVAPWVPPSLNSSDDQSDGEVGVGVTTAGLEEAVRLADQGSLDEARRLCETTQAKDPLNPEVRLLLAMICQEQGDMRGALDALRQAIYLDASSAPAHFLVGSLVRRRDPRRARRSMETVVALLSARPPEEALSGSNGLTTGRLRETARAYLEAMDE